MYGHDETISIMEKDLLRVISINISALNWNEERVPLEESCFSKQINFAHFEYSAKRVGHTQRLVEAALKDKIIRM